jgi:hypothetical protein
MTQPTNAERAEWASLAIETFADATGLNTDVEMAEAIGDLIADMHHLADSLGLDFAAILATASMHYSEEKAEEEAEEEGGE